MPQPILVATNFDRNSNATRWGVQLAQALQLPLLLAHVVEPVGEPAKADLEIQLFHKQLLDDGQIKLNQELQQCSAGDCAGTLIEVGPRLETLLQVIEDHHPQMLIMGKRLNAPEHTPISLQILARTSCPVVLVPDGPPPEQASYDLE